MIFKYHSFGQYEDLIYLIILHYKILLVILSLNSQLRLYVAIKTFQFFYFKQKLGQNNIVTHVHVSGFLNIDVSKACDLCIDLNDFLIKKFNEGFFICQNLFLISSLLFALIINVILNPLALQINCMITDCYPKLLRKLLLQQNENLEIKKLIKQLACLGV